MFMINLRGLIILSLFLLGDARRSSRIEDSRHDAQLHSKMLTNGFKVSAEGKDALLPTGLSKALSRQGKKLLPEEDASPRFPSATMNLGHDRWSPRYDKTEEGLYDLPWGGHLDRWGDEWGGRWSTYETTPRMNYERRNSLGNPRGRSRSPPAPPPAPPPELTFDDIFAQADPDKKYADKYEALKTALAAQDIHTVAILAELSTAEVSQIPDLTAGLRRFLEKSISPHRPQPMFDDRLPVRSDFRNDMGGYGKYGRRGYDMDGYGKYGRRWYDMDNSGRRFGLPYY